MFNLKPMNKCHDFSGTAPGIAGLVLALVLALAGCAVSQPKDEPHRDTITPEKTEQVDSKLRDDFDEAMKSLEAGNLDKGIAQLNQLTQRAKTNTAPYINLAIAYQKQGNLGAAEEDLKKALAINPDHPVANNEYGLLYRRTGRFAEAKKAYERALEISPLFLPARKNLAILCDLYLRDMDCALKNYQLYSQAVPDDKAVGIWIADLQKRLGR